MKATSQSFFPVFAAGVSLILAMNFSTAYAASCKASIINNSHQPWTIENKAKKGNLHFSQGSCKVNGPCQIQPGQSIPITYTQTWGSSVGTTIFIDNQGKSKSFQYDNKPGWICPATISSDSIETAIEPGQPSLGSYTIVKGTWDK
jgi:uncharacterized Fe-S cluster protein YjdI